MAAHTGVSAETLRYYERIGLLTDVDRAPNGHRRYDDDDVEWVGTLRCLRLTGMGISDMQHFAELVRAGQHTAADRLRLLEDHRESVLDLLADLRASLQVVEDKISHYRAVTQDQGSA